MMYLDVKRCRWSCAAAQSPSATSTGEQQLQYACSPTECIPVREMGLLRQRRMQALS